MLDGLSSDQKRRRIARNCSETWSGARSALVDLGAGGGRALGVEGGIGPEPVEGLEPDVQSGIERHGETAGTQRLRERAAIGDQGGMPLTWASATTRPKVSS